MCMCVDNIRLCVDTFRVYAWRETEDPTKRKQLVLYSGEVLHYNANKVVARCPPETGRQHGFALRV